jgi:hypothetical protein
MSPVPERNTMTILLYVLLLIAILAFGGCGYGYFRGGAYASPLGMLGLAMLGTLTLLLLTGWQIAWKPVW